MADGGALLYPFKPCGSLLHGSLFLAGHTNFSMLTWSFLHDLILSTIHSESQVDLLRRWQHSFPLGKTQLSPCRCCATYLKSYHLLLPFPQPSAVEEHALYRGSFCFASRFNYQMEKVKNHDFTHMWDIQLKPTNEQIRKTKKQTKTHR